mgnify:CR=1 FL=1
MSEDSNRLCGVCIILMIPILVIILMNHLIEVLG